MFIYEICTMICLIVFHCKPTWVGGVAQDSRLMKRGHEFNSHFYKVLAIGVASRPIMSRPHGINGGKVSNTHGHKIKKKEKKRKKVSFTVMSKDFFPHFVIPLRYQLLCIDNGVKVNRRSYRNNST